MSTLRLPQGQAALVPVQGQGPAQGPEPEPEPVQGLAQGQGLEPGQALASAQALEHTADRTPTIRMSRCTPSSWMAPELGQG